MISYYIFSLFISSPSYVESWVFLGALWEQYRCVGWNLHFLAWDARVLRDLASVHLSKAFHFLTNYPMPYISSMPTVCDPVTLNMLLLCLKCPPLPYSPGRNLTLKKLSSSLASSMKPSLNSIFNKWSLFLVYLHLFLFSFYCNICHTVLCTL